MLAIARPGGAAQVRTACLRRPTLAVRSALSCAEDGGGGQAARQRSQAATVEQPSRRTLLLRTAAALSCAPLQALAAAEAQPLKPQLFENRLIGFQFTVPPSWKREVAGGLFGRAAEALAFGGAVSYDGAGGARIELTTQTLPPGPQYARLDPKQWTASDAADSVLEGKVISQALRRFGDCDAWFFESRTEGESGFTVATLKKDSNFANHLVVLSAHVPTAAFERAKPDLLSTIESLAFDDFAAELSDADLKVARPLGR